MSIHSYTKASVKSHPFVSIKITPFFNVNGLGNFFSVWLQQIADKFINSTRVCSYELRDDNVKKVNCRESHVFNPFSYDGQRGVATYIQQELKFKEAGSINSILKIKGEPFSWDEREFANILACEGKEVGISKI